MILYHNNLVGGWPIPLKNMSSSVGMIIPYIVENKKMFKTTNQSSSSELQGWKNHRYSAALPQFQCFVLREIELWFAMACTSKMQRFLVVVPSTQFWDSWRFWAYFSPSTRFHWFCLPWNVRIDRRLRPPCWHVLTLKLCFGVMSRPAWASFLPERRLVISSLLLLSQVFLPWHLAHVDWLAISWLELSITLVAWSPSFGPFADANIYIYHMVDSQFPINAQLQVHISSVETSWAHLHQVQSSKSPDVELVYTIGASTSRPQH